MDLRESNITEGSKQGRHPWEIARKKAVVDLLNKNIPNSNEKKTILDIGCGDTWLVEELSEIFTHYHFIAVDIAFDEHLLEKYRKRLEGKPIEVFDSLEIALKDKAIEVDAILLLDVIEHIENDISFLKWVQEYQKQITSKTHFFITVPAYQALFCSHDHFLGHYRRYTNTLLKHNVGLAGLEVKKIGYFFTVLLFPRIISVLIEKITKPANEAKGVAGWKKSPLDRLISGVLYLDYKVNQGFNYLGIKIPGLSNYVICKKPA